MGWPDVDVSADGGEFRLFTEGAQADQDRTDDVGLGGTDGAASGIRGPELQTGF